MRRLLLFAAMTSLVCSSLGAQDDDPFSEDKGPIKRPKPKQDQTPIAAVLKISGSLPESAGQLGLFGELEQNLPGLIRRLDRAAGDSNVKAVVLRLRTPSVGRAKIAELRAAIKRVRDADKRVVAQLRQGMTADYLIASACDEIIMPESGVLMVPGVRAEIMFYKGLFDKLGIEGDMMQAGDFKGAAEPYTRKNMSPELRKQLGSMVDDFYDQLVTSIASDRGIDADRVKELIDVGVFTPSEAVEAGLVDRIAYEDELETHLRETTKSDKLTIAKDYGKKKLDADFSGMLGMIKLFELMLGVESSQRSSKNRKIAVVFASGAIVTGESMSSLFGGSVMGSDTIVRALRRAKDDETVAAIVLRVDSPGGSALASDLIWREIEQCEKPVIATMGDVAASGGYYISMGCDRIFAEAGTQTGSIGVVSGKIALGGLMDKVGITTDVISRGKNSGVLASNRPFTDSERQALRKMMQDIYRQFTTKAAAGRKMDLAELEKLAGGRIWTGRQAKANGLVDELGSLRDAIAHAKQASGFKDGEKAELLILPKPVSIFDQLLGGGGLGIESPLGSHVARAIPELAEPLAEIQQLKRLFAEPALYVMPFRVRIR